MAASLAPSRSVPIALLYQAPSLHQHLKQALSDLGASVVYDTPAENFDRGALDRSGAEVVVINLDPDVDEEFEHLGDLLADEALKVIFNDGEVSSRLEGWDQARWARHLAAKILGVSDTNPPRPQGSSAVTVKVRSAAPEQPGASDVDGSFELHGQDFERALSADTGEAISLTRAALVTKDEPVAAQLVPRPDMKDMPTLELPVGDLVRDIPQWQKSEAAAPAAPAVAAPPVPAASPVTAKAPEAAPAPVAAFVPVPVPAIAPAPPPAVAEEFAAVLRDFGFLNEPIPVARTTTTPAPADDEFDALGALDGAATGATPDDDEFSDFGLSLESDEPASRVPVQELDELMFDEPDVAAPARPSQAGAIDELSLDDLDDAPTGAAVDAPLSEFDLGSIELEPFDESGGGSNFGSVSESAAPQGLDDFLFDLSLEEAEKTDKGDKGDKEARPVKSDKPVGVEVARHAASMRATPTVEGKVLSSARPQLNEPAVPAARTAPVAAQRAEPATPTPAAPRKFDFSGLSLEPTDEDRLSAPVTGRASYRIDEHERKQVAPPPMPTVAPPAPVAMPVADDDEFSLGALEFTLDDSTPINTSSVVRDTAVESEEEPDLMAELEAVVGPTTPVAEAEVDGPVRRVWVLGASIGGPEAVREFLAAIEPRVPALFLLAQHMGSDFVDLMTQQLARATKLNVRNVAAGDKVGYGDVIVVPLTERMQVDKQGSVKLSALDSMSPYSPSIDQVLMDVADRFGANAGAIIFSGMAHDAIDGSVYLSQKGGKVWAQDPATCVISSMVDGARDAGVVTFTGSPAELARQFQLEMFRAG